MSEMPEAPAVGTYVYCVARAAPFDAFPGFVSTAIGTEDGPVRTIRYEDLVAVVSTSPNIRYTLRREYLQAHERVVEEASRYSAVLPVAFGTVAMNDAQVLGQLLQRRFDELHETLQTVEGRVELDLKAHWQREAAFAEVVAEDEQIRMLRDVVANQSSDAGYYDRIELGERTEQALAAKRVRDAEAILDVLEPLAVNTRVNKELTDMMVLNAAFLVDKEREQDFDEKVRELGDAGAGRMLLQYVGPVPPYNFVNIRVRWEA
ncbi:MAG TPA: GvpL/GvpF family gas vesicle protein [Chloroflexota bacterium]|nr:GvpL/GvpF family gas vesicle protein [Chloroflexota bacterium]